MDKPIQSLRHKAYFRCTRISRTSSFWVRWTVKTSLECGLAFDMIVSGRLARFGVSLRNGNTRRLVTERMSAKEKKNQSYYELENICLRVCPERYALVALVVYCSSVSSHKKQKAVLPDFRAEPHECPGHFGSLSFRFQLKSPITKESSSCE